MATRPLILHDFTQDGIRLVKCVLLRTIKKNKAVTSTAIPLTDKDRQYIEEVKQEGLETGMSWFRLFTVL